MRRTLRLVNGGSRVIGLRAWPVRTQCGTTRCSAKTDRHIEDDAVTQLFNVTVEMAEQRGLLSCDPVSVDGTLVHAWASYESMRRKAGLYDGRRLEIWLGAPRSSATHEFKRDSESSCTARAMGRLRCRATWATY